MSELTHQHHQHHQHHRHHGAGRALLISLVFTTAFAAVEAIGGWWANSLALLADAGHMITDSSALAIGVFAIWLARKPASSRHSFGLQRAEVLGALLNALLMLGVIVAIAWSAVSRLADPPAVGGGMVMAIGGLGLLVNLIVAWILTRDEQTMNVRAALLHVIGDLLGSVAALAAGTIIYFGGPAVVDPLLSLFVSLLILVSAGRLLSEVLHVLMEGVPRNIDVVELGRAMSEVDGVASVHDLHVWTLSSRNIALAAHVKLQVLDQWEHILPSLRALLKDRFDITHSTLQPESANGEGDCGSDPGCGSQS